MSFPLSRALSAATGAYCVFSLAKPRHLGNALSKDPAVQAQYDPVAYTYALRDLAVSTVGTFGRTPTAVRTAMVLRVAADAADAMVLSREAKTTDARNKILGVTLGWGAINLLALLIEHRDR